MTTIHPRQLSQVEQNARDYLLNSIVQHMTRGAERSDLQRQGYSDADIDAACERMVREAPEVKV